jgi:hypothetical protein
LYFLKTTKEENEMELLSPLKLSQMWKHLNGILAETKLSF